MKKEFYEIRLATGTDKVKGYTFTTGRHSFGITNELKGRVMRGWWSITELTTGLNAMPFGRTFKTLDEAISAVVDLLNDCGNFDALLSGAIEKFGRLNEGIEPKNAIISAKYN